MNWFGLLKTAQDALLTPPFTSPSTTAPDTPPSAAPTSGLPASPVPPASSAGSVNVTAEVTKNQYGSYFLVLSGDTFALNKQLNLGRTGMGFNWFGAKKSWSKKLELISPQDLQGLGQAGVNLSVLQQPEYQNIVGGRLQGQDDPDAPKTPATEKIQKFRDEIAKVVGEGGGSDKVKAMTAHVDKTLEQLALSVDEAAKQSFIKSFLVFSGKFWQYSFQNQMLIFIQRPAATYCRGPRQWEKMGRRVTNSRNGISILSPRFAKEKEKDEQRPGWIMTDHDGSNKEQLTGKRPSRPMWFAPVEVFDISDTEAIAGWTDPETGSGPFEGGDKYRVDSNDADEHIDTFVNAAMDFAQQVGIKLDLEGVMSDQTGGYSAGGSVSINKKLQGINQFSVVVHELAHEALHWDANSQMTNADLKSLGDFLKEKGLGDRVYTDLVANSPWNEKKMIQHISQRYSREVAMEAVRWSKQQKEIEAESTAFIVLNHFGIETKTAPNYLALWKANSDKVRSRRDSIVKAVKTIIQGIESNMHETPNSPAQQAQGQGGVVAQASSLANWYLRAKFGVKRISPSLSNYFLHTSN